MIFRRAGWRWPVFLLIVLAASWPVLSGRRFITNDSINEFFPQAVFVVRSVLAGDAPWWNPLVFGGLPVLGDPQGMIFTPHVLVGLLAGHAFNQLAFDLTTLACPAVGAAALMVYARRAGGAPPFALLGAATFMLAGVASSRLQHVIQIASYGAIPLLLLAIQSLAARPSFGRAASLAALGLAFALNPNQVVFLGGLALVPFAVHHALQAPRPAAVAMWLAGAGVAVALMSLPMATSIAETIAASDRVALTLDDSAAASFPVFDALSLVLPGLYHPLAHGPTWAPTDPTQDYLYLGMVPALALLASVAYFGRNVAPVRIALLVLLAAFVYALGTNTPLYAVLFAYIPGVSAFRRPADGAFIMAAMGAVALGCINPARWRGHPGWAGLAALAAVLAGFVAATPGLIAFAAAHGQTPSLVHSGVLAAERLAVTVALVAVAWRVAPDRPWARGAAIMVALWTGADLLTAGRDSFFDDLATWPERALTRHPFRMKHAWSIETLDDARPEPGGLLRMEAQGSALGSALPLLLGLADTQGVNPVQPTAYRAVFGAQNLQMDAKRFTGAAPSYEAAPYRWIGLRYVLLHRYIVNHPGEFGHFGEVVVAQEADFRPGEWANPRPDVGPYAVWALPAYGKANLVEPEQTDWWATPMRPEPCRVTTYRNVLVAVACVAPHPARLVLGDAAAPGWRACVNGVATPIERFGGVLRSVPVPAGESRTVFLYEPVPFLRGTDCPA